MIFAYFEANKLVSNAKLGAKIYSTFFPTFAHATVHLSPAVQQKS